LELRSIVEVISEIKFKPSKDSEYFYHVVPKEFEDFTVDLKAKKLSNNNQLSIEKIRQFP